MSILAKIAKLFLRPDTISESGLSRSLLLGQETATCNSSQFSRSPCSSRRKEAEHERAWKSASLRRRLQVHAPNTQGRRKMASKLLNKTVKLLVAVANLSALAFSPVIPVGTFIRIYARELWFWELF